MDPGQMISWTRYGHRMIGSASDRAFDQRRRYLGAGLDLNAPQYHTAPGGTFQGESYHPPPAPVPIAHHVLSLHLGPAPASHPAVQAVLGPVAAPPAATADLPSAVAAPVAPEDCPSCTPKMLGAAAGGALAAGLLMYVVGLSTREKKKRR